MGVGSTEWSGVKKKMRSQLLVFAFGEGQKTDKNGVGLQGVVCNLPSYRERGLSPVTLGCLPCTAFAICREMVAKSSPSS